MRAGLLLFVLLGPRAQAEEASSPAQTTRSVETIAQAAPPTSPPTPSVEQLAERLRVMEEMNRRLAERLDQTTRQHTEQMNRLLERLGEKPLAPGVATPVETAPGRGDRIAGGGDTETEPVRDTQLPVESESSPDFGLGPDSDGPVPKYETQPIEFDIPSSRRLLPGLTGESGSALSRSRFGSGFQFETEDEEFLLQVHIQSQIEARMWGQNDQTPVKSGFFFPRQRIFFNGRMTRPIEYVFSINRGLGELNILETFLNFRVVDDRFQVRVGRYMTPLTYDQFAIRNLWLPTPERSLFTTNVGLNRQIGAMAWGYLLNKRLDYAAGVFTGPRNSFEDPNLGKDFIGFLNARPFQDSDSLSLLKDLNLGASVAYGIQDQPAVPQAFRIGAVAPTNASQADLAAAPFLTLNSGVSERGSRLLGSVHAAYFYKGLSLIGEWQYGRAGYAAHGRPIPVEVPISAYYVAGAYLLTGEHMDRRAMVKPLRPVVPVKRGGKIGPGAWELAGRVSMLQFGQEIFNAGLADPNLWADGVTTTEVGLNWYPNEYLKVYMFWLHGDFSEPVYYRPGGLQKTADMFWLRCQLFF